MVLQVKSWENWWCPSSMDIRDQAWAWCHKDPTSQWTISNVRTVCVCINTTTLVPDELTGKCECNQTEGSELESTNCSARKNKTKMQGGREKEKEPEEQRPGAENHLTKTVWILKVSRDKDFVWNTVIQIKIGPQMLTIINSPLRQKEGKSVKFCLGSLALLV